MRLRLLGRVEVWSAADQRWTRPRPQQRLVLALLVAHLGESCRTDVLQQALWGDDPPPRARRLVQGLVSRLRRALPSEDTADVLATVPGGWRLTLRREDVDATRFEDLVTDAQKLTDTEDADAADRLLDDALALWHGRPFGDLADHPLLSGERARLEERHLAARELWLRLRIKSGEVSDALAALSELVTAHPLRERLHELHMLALYQAGRPADALVAYQQVRGRLADELGTEPGPDLQALHTAILRHDVDDGDTAEGQQAAIPGRKPRSPALSWPCRRELPLIGRDTEFAEVETALDRATRGERQLILVAGDPGIGKTRLVAELADQALDRGVHVLVGRCTEGVGVPYQPFVEALRMDADAATDDDLRDRLGLHAGPLGRLLPDLVQRTGHPPPPTSTNPRLDRHHLFDAVTAWTRATALQTPLLLVLEDLQWATRETLLLLRQLVRTTARESLALAATYRDVPAESPDLVDTLAELGRHPGTTRVELGQLRPQDVGRIVASLADSSGPRPARLAGQLYEATAGNPLFVQELLANIPSGTTELPRAGGDLELPWTLRQLLDARVQWLDDTTLHLLEQAAVAGEQFDFPVVADAADQDLRSALASLEEAIGARLLVESGDATDRYGFSHAIMRQAMLDRPSPSRRARLHARLAASLQQAHADHVEPVLAELAHHLLAAGPAADPAQTRQVVRAAADASMAQLAYDEAADLYQRSIELLDDMGRTDGDQRLRCDLLTALGDAQQRAGSEDHSQTLLQALDLATDLADTDRIVEAAWANNRGYPSHLLSIDEERVAALERALEVLGPDQPGPRATLLALLAGELSFPGPDASTEARARRVSDDALALARRADDRVLARVLTVRQFTIQGPGTMNERLRDTTEVVQLADTLDDATLRMFARQWRAIAAMEAADRPEADRRIDEVLRLAEKLGEPFMGCTAYMLAANREMSWGDLDAVPTLANRAHDLGMEVGAVDIQGVTTFQLFWYHRECGDVEEILPRIEQLRSRYGKLPHWQTMLASAWWEVGRRDEAMEVVDRFCADGVERVAAGIAGFHALCELAELAAGGGQTTAAEQILPLLDPYADQLDADQALCTGPVAYYLGLLAMTLGEWDRAEARLRQAARISQKVDAPRWRRRIRHAQAGLLSSRSSS